MTEKSHEQYERSSTDHESETDFVEYDARDFKWQDLAECKDLDTDLFFPERGGSTKEAKAVCAVREDCLEYAIVHERDGIWGGTSEGERQRIRKARASRAASYVMAVVLEA